MNKRKGDSGFKYAHFWWLQCWLIRGVKQILKALFPWVDCGLKWFTKSINPPKWSTSTHQKFPKFLVIPKNNSLFLVRSKKKHHPQENHPFFYYVRPNLFFIGSPHNSLYNPIYKRVFFGGTPKIHTHPPTHPSDPSPIDLSYIKTGKVTEATEACDQLIPDGFVGRLRYVYTPRKLTFWTPNMEIWFRWFSGFQLGWFLGSMLIFRGVAIRSRSYTNHPLYRSLPKTTQT